MNKRVDIITNQAGQARPYADSIYDSDILFSFIDTDYDGQYNPPEVIVRKVAQALVRPFAYDKDDIARPWFATYLDTIEQIGKGHWHVRIIQPYDG